MALTVRDLTKLQCFQPLTLVSGKSGLENKVSGMGILDYELMPEFIDDFLQTFTPGDFVLCSFLYQYCTNRPEEILPMVKALYSYGAAGIGFKAILYPTLPEEVLNFADEKKFPVFQFGKDTYYENLVYEITDALQTDDRNLLTSENIDSMILGTMPQNRIYTIAKNLSISFKEWCQVTYVTFYSDVFKRNISRYFQNFYLNRNLSNKAMIAPYQDGFFIISTSNRKDEKYFDMILHDVLTYLNVPSEEIRLRENVLRRSEENGVTPYKNNNFHKDSLLSCSSQIHKSFESLDQCFKESFHTYVASLAEGRNFYSYQNLGVYEILVKHYKSTEMEQYMQRYLEPMLDKEDYMDTAVALVHAGGDIVKAAEIFGCHRNTIRYKLARMHEMIGNAPENENDFFMNLSLAVRIYLLRQVGK